MRRHDKGVGADFDSDLFVTQNGGWPQRLQRDSQPKWRKGVRGQDSEIREEELF